MLSSFLQKSSKCLGILLAATSGLLLTLYSALYESIKTDIDNSTVLVLRGLIQVSVMALILGGNFTKLLRMGSWCLKSLTVSQMGNNCLQMQNGQAFWSN